MSRQRRWVLVVLVAFAALPTSLRADDEAPPDPVALGRWEGLLPFGTRRGPSRGAREGDAVYQQRRQSIESGLTWLACHQDPNGVFDLGDLAWADGKHVEAVPGTVGRAEFVIPVHALCLCAFLGAGYDPRGDHPHAKTLRTGLTALARLLHLEGEPSKRYALTRQQTHTMAASFGLRAMVEAFAATGEERYRKWAVDLLGTVMAARSRYTGWGYSTNDPRPDTFMTACALFGLDAVYTTNHAARLAQLDPPLHVTCLGDPQGQLQGCWGAGEWFRIHVDPATGAVGYAREAAAGTTHTAAGRPMPTSPAAGQAMALWCFQRCPGSVCSGKPCISPKTMRLWQRTILKIPTAWGEPEAPHDLVQWWFVGMAAAGVGDERAGTWLAALVKTLCEHQVRVGERSGLLGSWSPVGKWGFASGRLGTTALAVLTLEAPELTPVRERARVATKGPRKDLETRDLTGALRPEVEGDLLIAWARFGDSQAASAARARLDHPDPRVRRAARLALELLGDD